MIVRRNPISSRTQSACDPAASADLAAIMVQEGLAHLCLVGAAQTIVKARVEVRKRRRLLLSLLLLLLLLC